MANEYPIGTEGKPWGTKEITLWLNQQSIKRRYADEVLVTINSLRDDFELVQYGHLPYDQNRYPLYVAKTKTGKPIRQPCWLLGACTDMKLAVFKEP